VELLITNDDGSTTKFTEDMAVTAIKERDQLRTETERYKEYNNKSSDRLFNVRQQVFNFFNNEYEAGETELTFQVDDINTLLKDIGCDLLRSLFTVRGTVTYEITDVEAESEDDAKDAVENYLSLEYTGEGDLSDWSVEVDRVDQQ
jgi:hypothetical protein